MMHIKSIAHQNHKCINIINASKINGTPKIISAPQTNRTPELFVASKTNYIYASNKPNVRLE